LRRGFAVASFAGTVSEARVTYLLFLVGLAGLFFGGDALVRGASGVAQAFRVPPLVIGLILVGFGTSAPELLVSLNAALSGQPGIAIGNVVGSCIANILLILGIAAVIGPIPAAFPQLARDLGWMAAAALVMVPVFAGGLVSRPEGLLLVAALGFYIWRSMRGPSMPVSDVPAPPLPGSVLIALAGLAGVLIGAHLLVQSASEIARTFGISEAVIGLTIVAVGTSLPELATTVAAAMRGERDIALGNVIGSNVFNVFGILGLTALTTPVPVEARFLTVDVPVLAAAMAALVALIVLKGRLPRPAGIAALAAYALYIGVSGQV
jgi:cation:H+ antiporter